MVRDSEADALYRGGLNSFVGRRDELAQEHAREGDADGAKAIRALRKPSKVAWAVNQISHLQPELRDRLLDAGAALREAPPAQARQATAAEREVVGEVVEATGRLAAETNAPLSRPGLEKVRQTLHAVALDEETREQFARGILTEEHEAVGLGFSGGASESPPDARSKTAPAQKTRSAQDAQKRELKAIKAAQAQERKLRKQRGDAERALEQARHEAAEAQRALKRAQSRLEDARAQAARARNKVEELRQKS